MAAYAVTGEHRDTERVQRDAGMPFTLEDYAAAAYDRRLLDHRPGQA